MTSPAKPRHRWFRFFGPAPHRHQVWTARLNGLAMVIGFTGILVMAILRGQATITGVVCFVALIGFAAAVAARGWSSDPKDETRD